MALLKIAKLGNPVLRQVATAIDLNELVDPASDLQAFIDDMIETMYHEGGVGLAAPQVNRSVQIVVLEYTENARYPGEISIPLTVLVNPVLSDYSKETPRWVGKLSEFSGLPRVGSQINDHHTKCL